MKIAFLLPTDEFGKDGIADYTSRLAGEAERSGHETLLVPLGRNNWLSAGNILRENMRSAERRIREFSPDAVSWQFDGRIFHPLCIFPKLCVPRFSGMAKKVQLMAHETWEGDEEGARFRRRFKGNFQRLSTRSALQVINPDVIHTSNELYQYHLKSLGYHPTILPLFSSVSVVNDDTSESDDRRSPIKLVFFGGMREDQWNPSEFFDQLKATGREFEIHHVGYVQNPRGLELLRADCRDWAPLVEHGPQSDQRLSQILTSAHFAVSTYNLLHLRKSSIYATFLDHGLPVIVPRQDKRATRNHRFTAPIPDRVILPQDLNAAFDRNGSFPMQSTLARSCRQFLHDISP